MTIARELVTLLRYEIDESNLNKFNRTRPGGRAPNNVPGMPTPATIDATSNGLGRLGTVLRGLVAGFSIISATRIADEWAGVQGRVGLVTNGIEEQTEALTGLYELAQRTRQAYGATAQVFQGIARNGKELGLELEQQLKLTETIGTAMTIGGGSAQSQEAALMQLSQALGTGTLRGEELNSIMEQAPRLAQAIAKAFDVPVGKLKELGQAGKLSSKILAQGLLKQSETLREEFERMPMTFAGAWVTLSNALGRQIDKLNRNTGAARVFYKITSLVVDNLETIIKYIAFIGSAVALTKLAQASRAIAASGGLLNRVLARFGGANAFGVLLGTFIRMLAVVTALYYVFDDIGVWFRGGDSLLGDILGPMKEWQWLIDGVKSGLTFIKDTLGGSATGLQEWLSKWGLIAVIVGGIVAAIGLIPTLVTAGIVAFAALFNYLRKNWAAVPDWVKKAATIVGSVASGPIGALGGVPLLESIRGPSAPITPGGAAFGVTPSMLPNRGGGTTMITQAPQVTVNATTSQPAAVAEASRRGVERGMVSAMVPNVEVAR